MEEEHPLVRDYETERAIAFASIVEGYMPEDKDFILEMDEEDALGYVYGMLLEMGEDPDIILKDFGLTEGEADEF